MNGTIQNNPGPRSPMNRPNRSTIARSHCCAMRGAGISTMPTIAMMTSGSGLPVAVVTARPIATAPMQNGDGDDVDSRSGAHVIRRRLRADTIEPPLRVTAPGRDHALTTFEGNGAEL